MRWPWCSRLNSLDTGSFGWRISEIPVFASSWKNWRSQLLGSPARSRNIDSIADNGSSPLSSTCPQKVIDHDLGSKYFTKNRRLSLRFGSMSVQGESSERRGADTLEAMEEDWYWTKNICISFGLYCNGLSPSSSKWVGIFFFLSKMEARKNHRAHADRKIWWSIPVHMTLFGVWRRLLPRS